MTRHKTVFKHFVERVLNASQTLGGVVVFVVDVKYVVGNGFPGFFAEQVVVYKRLGGFARKFHHHAGRRVGIHIGVFACDVVVFGVDNLLKHVGCAGFASHIARMTVFDVGACHLLIRALHQFVFHHVLNFFHCHLTLAAHTNAVGNALYQRFIVAHFGGYHRFANRCLYLFFVVAHLAAVTL